MNIGEVKWKDDKVLSKGTLKFSGTLLGLPTGKDTWCMNIKKLLKSQPTKLTIEFIESEYYGKGDYKNGGCVQMDTSLIKDFKETCF